MKYVIFSISLFVSLLINLNIISNSYHFITPIFCISTSIYKIVSVTVYLLVCLAIFIIYKKVNFEFLNCKKLMIITVINYLLYTLFNLFTFFFPSPFLLFAIKTFHFISTLYLNEEVVLQNKISANLLVPYIIWTFYLTLVSISIFFLNNN